MSYKKLELSKLGCQIATICLNQKSETYSIKVIFMTPENNKPGQVNLNPKTDINYKDILDEYNQHGINVEINKVTDQEPPAYNFTSEAKTQDLANPEIKVYNLNPKVEELNPNGNNSSSPTLENQIAPEFTQLDPKPIAVVNNPSQSKKLSLSLSWFILAIIIVIASFSLAGVSYYNYYQNQLPQSNLNIVTSQKIATKPDTAKNTFYITLNGTNAVELNTQIDALAAQFITYLKEQGANDQDIITSKNNYPYVTYGLNNSVEPQPVSTSSTSVRAISPNSENILEPSPAIDIGLPGLLNPEPNEKLISVQLILDITLNNFQLKSDILDNVTNKAINIGITSFSGFRFSLSNSKDLCADLKNTTIEKAIKAGENRVKVAGGKTILSKEIRDVSYSDSCQNDVYLPYYTDAVSSKSSPDSAVSSQIAPDNLGSRNNQDLEATVEVTFKYR